MAKRQAIRAYGLTKRFGDFTAVEGIDFDVQSGEIFGFLGPNGSGKTTTIRMMLGLMKPTQGSVEVLGESVSKNPEKIRPRLGYMSQRFSLYNDLTVLENLRFYGRAYGLDRQALRIRIPDVLQLAGLEGVENVRTRDLSGGWRQRLALSATILHSPELLFLDEPTAGVDPVSRRAFWSLLYALSGIGITMFVTTHYMDEAERCHRLAFIQRGRLIALGTPGEIKRGMMKGQVLEITLEDSSRAMKVLRTARDEKRLAVGEIALYGSMLHVVAPDVRQLRGVIASILLEEGITLGRMVVIEPSLEDVFIASMH
ncbi:MAG: ABC transporter ATP-binding protein [Anaerolineales bacterium]|jgi:ABC-2 type transport system ATP-binding protein